MDILQLMPASNILVGILILFLVFLVLRELVTWYWKINKIVDLLEQIAENTRKEGSEIGRTGPFTDGPISKAENEKGE